MQKVPESCLEFDLTPEQLKHLEKLMNEKWGGLDVTYTKSKVENGKLKLSYVACNPNFTTRAGDPT